jgi:hypothetical protein
MDKKQEQYAAIVLQEPDHIDIVPSIQNDDSGLSLFFMFKEGGAGAEVDLTGKQQPFRRPGPEASVVAVMLTPKVAVRLIEALQSDRVLAWMKREVDQGRGQKDGRVLIKSHEDVKAEAEKLGMGHMVKAPNITVHDVPKRKQ